MSQLFLVGEELEETCKELRKAMEGISGRTEMCALLEIVKKLQQVADDINADEDADKPNKFFLMYDLPVKTKKDGTGDDDKRNYDPIYDVLGKDELDAKDVSQSVYYIESSEKDIDDVFTAIWNEVEEKYKDKDKITVCEVRHIRTKNTPEISNC